MTSAAATVAGTRGGGRFTLVALIGAGGMGEVYEAIDLDDGGRVALKTLPRDDGAAIARFKAEFRVLRDMRHPGLVRMRELVRDDQGWFFTMERIHGRSLLAYLRPDSAPRVARTVSDSAAAPSILAASSGRHHDVEPIGGALDPPRIAEAFAQVAEALAQLHAVGKIHRDIKPSNVLVEDGGRVVLLDLGLAIDETSRADRAGTVAYMAPEQAAGVAIGPAADLYALGVALFEVLTGTLPHVGTRAEILAARARHDDAWRARLVDGDLAALCTALLSPDPSARPTAREVAGRLGGARGATPSRTGAALVGRGAELAVLEHALAQVHAGAAARLEIHGEAGIGKTALIAQFARHAASTGALVMTARCSERELVPFRGVDGIVDQLAAYLMTLPATARAALLPADAGLLAAAFPVMASVVDAASAPTIGVPRDRRDRMFDAFRALIVALASAGPCVVIVDDLHWADDDSIALLGHALAADPPLMLLTTSRNTAGLGGAAVAVPLAALGGAATTELAASLLRARGIVDGAAASRLASECHGHPLFLEELATSAGDASTGLGAHLGHRIEALAGPLRRVLELVAVAPGPVRRDILFDCCAETGLTGGLGDAIGLLCAQRLTASATAGDVLAVEPYHARVREIVIGHLADDRRRRHHHDLAEALERRGVDEAEALATHWQDAAVPARAVPYAERVAVAAADALAFERAARWYHRAAQLAEDAGLPASERARLQFERGDALVNGGHGADAATAFLASARLLGDGAAVGVPEPAELRRRAAEQLMLSGRIDEGLALLRSELAAAGLPMPARTRTTLLRLAMRRWQVLLASRSAPAPRPHADPIALRRIDLTWSLAHALSLVDTFAGAEAQSHHLLLALRAGEPFRIARAFALEAGYLAAIRGGQVRADRALEAARRAATISGDPHAAALVTLSACVGAYMRGRYPEAIAFGLDAEARLGAGLPGVAWELGIARHHTLMALIYAGEMRQVRARAASLIAEARSRGDRYGEVFLRTGITPFLHLSDDAPGESARDAVAASAAWEQPRWTVQLYATLMATAQGALYEGRGADALDEVRDRWGALRRTMLLNVGLVRIEALRLRARGALAVAATSTGLRRRRWCAAAARDARRIDGEGGVPARPFAALLHAGVAAVAGDPAEALRWLEVAEPQFRDAGMGLMTATARRSRGLLLGGDRGRALITEAERWMTDQTIANPARMAAMLAPGLRHL